VHHDRVREVESPEEEGGRRGDFGIAAATGEGGVRSDEEGDFGAVEGEEEGLFGGGEEGVGAAGGGGELGAVVGVEGGGGEGFEGGFSGVVEKEFGAFAAGGGEAINLAEDADVGVLGGV